MKLHLVTVSLVFCLGACSSNTDTPIASINGNDIYQQEFDAYLQYKRSNARSDEDKKALLDRYLQREALARLIEDHHFQTEHVVQAEIDELRREVLINRYFDHYLTEQVTEEAILNDYNLNIDQYEEKKIHVAHILLRVNRNMDESQRQVKRTTIQEAYSKLQAGMPFAEAAQQYSEDTVSAKKGGDLGWITEGSIDQLFSQTAFATPEGQFSQPIETAYGFHIIQVLEPVEVSRKSFESVKGQIRYKLRQAAKASERERLLNDIAIVKG